jgi:hypothetical protein
MRRSGLALVAWTILPVLLGAGRPPAVAAGPAGAPPPIRDNSFLVEEAYNQEDGVIQHISAFMRLRDSREWVYSFTQEWPAPTLKNQISFTVPLQRPAGGTGAASGVGDVALNYRYQARGGGEERVALAPRLSLLLPTGEEREGRGVGGAGVQVNLPLSIEVSRRLASHSNVGATFVPSARNDVGDEASVTGFHAGQSFVWLLRPTLNLMLEAAWSSDEEVAGPGRTSRASAFFVSPGLRAAFNFESGLQIVPGLAFPVGLGGSRGENGVFLYLSFEHPIGRPGAL